jgi:hypothetical protein
MNTIQTFSILIELVVAIIGITIWLQKKKSYGGFIFLSFIIFVFYDIARLWDFGVSELILCILFAISCISMLLAVWQIYKSN